MDAIDDLLNRGPGLRVCVGSTTFASSAASSPTATRPPRLAYDVYVHRLRKYIGAYLVALGRVDAIAFTAGVGENAAEVRADALAGLEGSASRRSRSQPLKRAWSAGDLYRRLADQGSRAADQRRTGDSTGRLAVRLTCRVSTILFAEIFRLKELRWQPQTPQPTRAPSKRPRPDPGAEREADPAGQGIRSELP